jgi:hypothetical protein
LGCTCDGAPGSRVLWEGVQPLMDLTALYRIMRPITLPTTVGKDSLKSVSVRAVGSYRDFV